MLRNLTPDIFLSLPALLIALTFHEYAHAWAANHLGDPSPRMRGRLTLNPLAHIDPVGFLMLLLFRFGWAKPVEVNPYNFDNREKGMAWVSLAGPAMNLILGLIAMIAYVGVAKWATIGARGSGVLPALSQLLFLISLYNVYFAIFNLIPIPPLDGSKLLFLFLPRSTVYRYLDVVGQYGFIILILAVSTGLVGGILGPITSTFIRLYQRIGFVLFGLY